MNGVFPLRPQDVLKVVADAYGVRPVELTIPGRASRPVEHARRVAARLIHDECWLSWPAVAGILGRSKSAWISRGAHNADPDALAVLLSQLRPNGIDR